LSTSSTPAQTYQLQEMISETILPCRKLASGLGVELEVINDLAASLTVKGDRALQKKLLHLVLATTIQHAKASRISLVIRQLLQSGKETLVEFSLVDNGMTRKLSAGNFAYFRSLAGTRKLIEHLGGKAGLITSPGMNTTLKFMMRYTREEPPTVKSQPGGGGAGKNLRGKKVLVAEDNEVNQKLIRQILERQGIGADFAANGKEAVEAMEKQEPPYDLVLMDLQMPYMDGFQAANYICKKLCRSIPIIGLTVGSADVNYVKCREAGMNHFIKKPFTEGELLAAIANYAETRYETA